MEKLMKDIKMSISFEEGFVKISELERKIKFLRGLPIEVGFCKKGLDIYFSADQTVFIRPQEGLVDYGKLNQIKDCEIKSTSKSTGIFDEKFEDNYHFFYSPKE